MNTFIEVSEREVFRRRKDGDRLFYERAGWCAEPNGYDGMVWERNPYDNTFIAYCNIPSPDWLLL